MKENQNKFNLTYKSFKGKKKIEMVCYFLIWIYLNWILRIGNLDNRFTP